MKERDQDDIPDFEEILGDEESEDDNDAGKKEQGIQELNFYYDERYRGDPEWDPSQR